MKHHSPAPVRASRSAFTLIEMLVVVSIIALLAAILFPAFAKVRESGRTQVCSSNLRQLGLAFNQYTSDYGGRYPFAGRYQYWANGGHWVSGGDATGPKNFTDAEKGMAQDGVGGPFTTIEGRQAYVEKGALYPYVKSAAVYTCPSAPDANKKKLSYSMNCAVAAMSPTRIRVPGEIVLLVDEGDTINDGFFWATVDHPDISTDSLFKGHNGGGNLLFCDGHVKFYNFNTLPLDSNGPATQAGTGQYLKTTTTGPVRFHDAAFGVKGSYSAPYLDPKKNACLDDITTTPKTPGTP